MVGIYKTNKPASRFGGKEGHLFRTVQGVLPGGLRRSLLRGATSMSAKSRKMRIEMIRHAKQLQAPSLFQDVYQHI